VAGPRISSTEPTFALFYKYTPLLNLGTRVGSVHLTTKQFYERCKNVPYGTTKAGGP
jgi:hypothetical protein